MGLVHGEKRDAVFAQQILRPFLCEPLRRGVKKPGPAARKSLDGGDGLVVVLRGMKRDGGDALVGERAELIAHQRDQRRGDDDEPRPRRRGKLIEERFARARRHDGEGVAPGEHGRDHLRLSRQELRIAEIAAQQFARCGEVMLRGRRVRRHHGRAARSAVAISAHSSSSGPSCGGRPARAYQ